MSRISAHVPFFGPTATVPTTATLSLNAAGSWFALSFMAQGKTLNTVRTYLDVVTGSPAASDITCSLQASTASAGLFYPDGTSIETRALSAFTEDTWVTWSGFTTALTAGQQYWLVFKNVNATPASNYMTFAFGSNMTMIHTAENTYGWMRRTTTDSGAGWSASVPSWGMLLGYSDGSYDGLPCRGQFVNAAADGIYAEREVGNLFTAPANVKLNVRGVAFLVSIMTGTPTGYPRFRLYEGTTLVRTSVGLTPGGETSNSWIHGYWDTPYALIPGTAYRAVLSETTQSDAQANRYNTRFVLWDRGTGGISRMPFGMEVQRTMYNSTNGWTEVADSVNGTFVPMVLLLEAGDEFVPAGVNVYPNEDLVAGSWTPSTGANLFDVLNDAPTNDTQRAVSSTGATDDSMTLGFPNVQTPTGTVVLKIRARTGS